MSRTIQKWLGPYSHIVLAGAIILGIAVISFSFAETSASEPGGAPPKFDIAALPQNNMAGWAIPSPETAQTDPQNAANIARGRYLTVAGDCLPCHSLAGEPAFSGGLAMGSPVGAVFSPNITPSKRYGIGNYTDKDFWNVLHNGIAPGSSLLVFPKYLYPSMPYDAYSKLSYADVMAIKAYLDSLPPAEIPSRPTQIPFPFNTRAALLGWRLLFFRPQPMQYDPGWTPQQRNGAFLVQALGHCSDCHTPRNLFFASEASKFLGGGHILAQSWFAPNISAAHQNGGIGGWRQADLLNYLHNGGSVGIGAPFGPMQEVVADSLSRLPASDVQDIIAYLQTATAAQASVQPPEAGSAAGGAQIYADNCARCHGANGEGVAGNFPNLAHNQSVWAGPSNNVISMVLGGFGPWHNDQSAMPGFRQTLSDSQIAAVSNYIRTAWGNQGVADATAVKVASLRGLTANEVTLDTGTAQAVLQTKDEIVQFDEISGSFSRDADQLNCQMDMQLSASGAADKVHLAGACAKQGGALQGHMTLNGKTVAITLLLRNIMSNGNVTGVAVYGLVSGGGYLIARIAMVAHNG